jgi:putative ABC transport system permease protein
MRLRAFAAAVLTAALAAVSTFAQPAPRTTAADAAVPDILVSRQLLESQTLSVGDVVSLSSRADGQDPQRFRIAGVYEPTPDPMRLGAVRHEVRMHLPDLLTMTADPGDPLDLDAVDAINVAVADKSAVESVGRNLISRLPGVVVELTGGGRAEPFVVLERFHFAIAVVTVIASSIFLLALMLMIIDERRAVVGILRLIGFRRRRILMHVLAEGAVIAIAGAVFGVMLSAVFQDAINRFFQWRYDTALIFVRITPAIALRSVALSVPLGVLATLIASWTILRRDVLALTRR